MKKGNNGLAFYVMMGTGCLIGLWAVAALISGIMAAGGIGALAGQYMTAIGMTTSFATLVDYYTYIKGIEYLICVSFFIVFPLFYSYVNSDKKEKTKAIA